MPHDTDDRVYPVPSGADGAWIAQACRLDAFECEAMFHVAPSFYFGPENGMTPAEWETANLRLSPPDLPRRFAEQVSTAELLGREAPLIEHYRRIVALAETHGKPRALQPFPYFRTEPAIIAGDAVLTEFTWNDSLHETRSALETLAEAGAGAPRLLHDDQDQSWRILIVHTDAATCFIEWDAEGPPPATGGYAVDSVELARQAGAALGRLGIIHERLVRGLGEDYWSFRRPSPAPAKMRRLRALARLLRGFR